MTSVYRQFTDRIAAEASRSASAFPVPSGFSWLAGEWTWLGQPALFAKTLYGVSLGGQPVRLRQTWSRDEEFAVEIVNERFSDKRWQRWDRSRLVRLTPPNWLGGL